MLLMTTFAASVIIIERREEKKYRTEMLEAKLDGYVATVDNYIKERGLGDSTIHKVCNLAEVLPDSIRLSIINEKGKVLYDRDIEDVAGMENHLKRPEIRGAALASYGSNIRMSASVHRPFIYYAKHFGNYFIRVALPYNVTTKSVLRADSGFVYALLLMLIMAIGMAWYISSRLTRSISNLRSLSRLIKGGKEDLSDFNYVFYKDEIGDVAEELYDLLLQKQEASARLEGERAKLIRHFRAASEGVGFFDEEGRRVYANVRYYTFVNSILERTSFQLEELFEAKELEEFRERLNGENRGEMECTAKLERNGKIYELHLYGYKDKSYEIIIKDITKSESGRLMKQQMTSNVAHELRTPVACLRGFLETVEENYEILKEEKKRQFIEKAYRQSVRLSELIDDISLLSKIDEMEKTVLLTDVSLNDIISKVKEDMADRMEEQGISWRDEHQDMRVKGNSELLFIVFRNLADNAIKYGGKDIEIGVKRIGEENGNLFLAFYDTGRGVDEIHFNRLFERFYRTNEGRTRNSGGTGLGLAIIKNIIQLHGGEISVKRHDSGGLEFIIRLVK